MARYTSIENVKLSLSCDKSWEGMLPCDSGKHCQSCNKTVIDFTHKSQKELQVALTKSEQVCGRFYQSQLAVASTKETSLFRRVAAGVLLTLGFSTFSKELKAQEAKTNKAEHKQEQEQIVLGMIQQTDPVYKHGGEQGMISFIKKNLRYPSDLKQDSFAVVTFIIDTTGQVTEPLIHNSLTPEADKEALRVAKMLEFYPGTLQNRKVPVRYLLPVRFRKEK